MTTISPNDVKLLIDCQHCITSMECGKDSNLESTSNIIRNMKSKYSNDEHMLHIIKELEFKLHVAKEFKKLISKWVKE